MQTTTTIELMISKKRFTTAQKISLFCIDAVELIAIKVPIILAVGLVGLAVVFTQKGINHRITNTCNRTIYELVHHPTAFGPAYQCVSRAQLRGPAKALKD
jgi:hypothetical protein